MNVLVACEYSGLVRDAFILRGHLAISCDYKESERPGPHYRGDVFDIIDSFWDLMIAFPPCTYLSSSGARWWKDRKEEQEHAIQFVKRLMQADIPKIAIENPVGVLSTRIRPPDQIIHPYEFGDRYTKSTCLWLKNLPLLIPTDERPLIRNPKGYADGTKKRYDIIHSKSPSKNRSHERSRTFPGTANAMADQWG